MSETLEGVIEDVAEVIDKVEENSVGLRLTGREQQVLAGLLAGVEESPSAASHCYLEEKTLSVTKEAKSATGHTMRAPLETAGITAQRLATVLEQGLRARKTTMVGGKRKMQPDHSVRLKFAELACKLRGDMPTAQTVNKDTMSYEERLRLMTSRPVTP